MCTQILSFRVSADLAHFRKPASNISRITYQIPPKMTIAGMLSAICRFEQDSYYDKFSPTDYAMSVEPLNPVRTVTIPQNVMGTAKKENFIRYNNRGKGPTLEIVDPSDMRKQRVFEYVKNPEYRINITLEDNELQSNIVSRLSDSKFEYTPSLGSAKCLARINPDSVVVQDCRKIENESVSVKTPVTDFDSIKDPTKGQIITEKITSGFGITEGSRGTKQRESVGFTRYLYRKDLQKNPLMVNTEESADRIYRSEDGSVLTLY